MDRERRHFLRFAGFSIGLLLIGHGGGSLGEGAFLKYSLRKEARKALANVAPTKKEIEEAERLAKEIRKKPFGWYDKEKFNKARKTHTLIEDIDLEVETDVDLGMEKAGYSRKKINIYWGELGVGVLASGITGYKILFEASRNKRST
jgi:hypothetical protein